MFILELYKKISCYNSDIVDPIFRYPEDILNIYKTMMLRGIKGTYVYVCDKSLHAYFKKAIKAHNTV